MTSGSSTSGKTLTRIRLHLLVVGSLCVDGKRRKPAPFTGF
jgi:hypothetical protein